MQRLVALCIILFCAVLPQLAHARATTFMPAENVFPPTVLPDENVVSDDKPVALTADRIDYYQHDDLVVASGHVEVVQGDTLVLADTITYDRRRSIVRAQGNVSVMDVTGSVMFADELELRDQLLSGVIEQFKMRLTDDSLFASERAVKVDENVMELDKALYSPCKVKCDDDLEPGESPHTPLWQLRANHVKIDQEKQSVVYHDAWMELYGLPVFYTPYLSHASPNADAKSGVMVPEFKRNDILGNVYTLPFYYSFSPDRDIIVTPIETSKEGWLLKSNYRQQFDNGLWKLDASITNPRERDAIGNLTSGRQLRGHLYSDADFDIDDDTRWGFDI